MLIHMAIEVIEKMTKYFMPNTSIVKEEAKIGVLESNAGMT